MDTKAKIIESQKRILDSLVDCETQVGKLYEMYAARFPSMKDQWLGLSGQEKVHANLLKTMHRFLDKGNTFYNLGKFDPAAIQPIVAIVLEAQAKVNDETLTSSEAISKALAIETSILDSHFYDVVTTEAPEFKIIAERLSADTKKHVDSIRHAFQQSQG